MLRLYLFVLVCVPTIFSAQCSSGSGSPRGRVPSDEIALTCPLGFGGTTSPLLRSLSTGTSEATDSQSVSGAGTVSPALSLGIASSRGSRGMSLDGFPVSPQIESLRENRMRTRQLISERNRILLCEAYADAAARSAARAETVRCVLADHVVRGFDTGDVLIDGPSGEEVCSLSRTYDDASVEFLAIFHREAAAKLDSAIEAHAKIPDSALVAIGMSSGEVVIWNPVLGTSSLAYECCNYGACPSLLWIEHGHLVAFYSNGTMVSIRGDGTTFFAEELFFPSVGQIMRDKNIPCVVSEGNLHSAWSAVQPQVIIDPAERKCYVVSSTDAGGRGIVACCALPQQDDPARDFSDNESDEGDC